MFAYESLCMLHSMHLIMPNKVELELDSVWKKTSWLYWHKFFVFSCHFKDLLVIAISSVSSYGQDFSVLQKLLRS